MTPAGTTSAALHLDGAVLDQIFPFHLAFDRAGRVAGLGPSLRGLLPSLSEGCVVAQHFAVRRPAVPLEYEAVSGKADVLFLLAACAREDLVLRGQMMPLPDQQRIVFLGSPLITDLDAMVRLGLKVDHYALHDPAADFLFLIQAQRRALEEAQTLTGKLREARDEAVRASRVKSEFLANMSHELRTPLNAIIGFSELIRDAQMGPLDATYCEYAGLIHESGTHLLDLIGNVLDFSNIEAERLELRETTVAVAAVIDSCRRLLLERAREADVALRLELPDDLPPVRADELRLRQIILNLLTNAVKFTPSGGEVAVSALAAGDGLWVAIRDTGIGMTAEEIPLAMEPFRQVDGQLNRRREGAGLGCRSASASSSCTAGLSRSRAHLGTAPWSASVCPPTGCWATCRHAPPSARDHLRFCRYRPPRDQLNRQLVSPSGRARCLGAFIEIRTAQVERRHHRARSRREPRALDRRPVVLLLELAGQRHPSAECR